MPPEFIPSPQWVMLGVDQPEGVLVFASKTLTMAELHEALNHSWRREPLGRFGSASYAHSEFSKAWELSVTMNEVFWATGTDYGDAIRRLFEMWSPEHDVAQVESPRALPAVMRELGR